jgi:branched-chain amino acid transport system substrate-binding protein
MKRMQVLALGMMAAALSWAPVRAEEPIRIGILSDMTGPFSGIAGKGSVYAAELALEDFGKNEVLGRKIEFVQGDHQNKADIGASIAREWFDRRGVTVIADLIGSAVGLAVQSVANRSNKILILSGSGADDLVGAQCAPGGFVWSVNTWTQSKVVGAGLMKQGAKSWFLVSQDSAFGKSIERNLTTFAAEEDAKIVGVARFPVVNQDFSSFLINAQGSNAQVVALTGGDVTSFVKQANEFGIVARGQKLAVMMAWVQWIHALGPQLAQGLYLSSSFYWDLNDETRKWSKRFYEKAGYMPSWTQAGSYSGILHYLRAVEKAGTTDNEKVIETMRAIPISDPTAKGKLRKDGLLLRDFYVFNVKSPQESKGEWDLYKLVSTIPAEEAAPPLSSACPYLK